MVCSDCIREKECKGHGTCNLTAFKCRGSAGYTGTHWEKEPGSYISEQLYCYAVSEILYKKQNVRYYVLMKLVVYTKLVNHEDTITLMINLEYI